MKLLCFGLSPLTLAALKATGKNKALQRDAEQVEEFTRTCHQVYEASH